MEGLALVYLTESYENPGQPQLRSFDELGLKIPSSAWLGMAGMMFSLLVITTGTPSLANSCGTGGCITVINAEVLSVRSGPGKDYSISSSLTRGAVVGTTGKLSNGWVELSNGGWIDANYAANGTLNSGTSGTSGTSTGQLVTVATQGSPLNIRSGPSTGYPVIGSVGNGKTVGINGVVSNGWYQLSSGGWIAGNYTVEGATSGSGGSVGGGGGGGGSTSTGRSVTVATNGSPLNIRSGPSTGYSVIGSVGNGKTVAINGVVSNGWYQLSSGGWIAGNYTVGGSGGTSAGGGGGSAGRSVTVATNGSPLNIRSGPSTGYSVIGSVGNGKSVAINGVVSNGWYQLSSGGWIAGNYTVGGSGGSSAGGGGGSGSAGGYQKRVATNGSPLLVRSAPGGAIINSLPNGTPIYLTGQYSGSWAQLQNGGWVSANWIR